ncbi:MAG: aminotransferase class I/II-fold pyridoxal phosphate-dependent enzyme [Coriobacteriales bacterium]|jgi:DNA-binding transcriptional MocR family regulator|nr:aminotransferase class I/II-fold pyridoxal phosphate-dependent enzyme [Coriobacteriales bacterium]
MEAVRPINRTEAYSEMPQEERRAALARERERHGAFVQRGLGLNMARGKPSPEQLDLSLPMLDLLSSQGSSEALREGEPDDLRNYGNLAGLSEMRTLMGAIMSVPAANVLAGGNSSLALMYNLVSMAMTQGVLGSAPWATLAEQPAFLCPVPGYDRHFALTEHFGIRMIPVPLGETGPDMDVVEGYVSSDPFVKGIWCVPRFSNPTGVVYSDETVERFARLAPAAEDFRIYWDNAYAVHDLMYEDAAGVAGVPGAEDMKNGMNPADEVDVPVAKGRARSGEAAARLSNLRDACERAANPDIWYEFASTSKITFAGSGVAALASSEANIQAITQTLGFQTIGPDKINQKRHALFLPDLAAVQAHMARHAALLRPKFELVDRVLSEGLTGAGVGSWTKPKGGYFISFDGPPHTATRTVELAAQAGVVLTPAGATYPYGADPLDANIRIAPTYPGLEELETAAEVFVVCARIAALEQLVES